MSLREELLEYMNKVAVPEELSPSKMGTAIFPDSYNKKKEQTEQKTLLSVPEVKQEQPAPSLIIPEEKAENPLISLPEEKEEKAEAPAALAEEKNEHTEKPLTSIQKNESSGREISKEEAKPPVTKEKPAEKKQGFKLNAYSFMKIVQSQRLTGKEFLELMGNSRMSNKAFLEIEQNPNLTQKRLVEILEESGLTEDDYEKLLVAINKRAKLKEQLRLREQEEAEKRKQAQESVQKLAALAQQKKQEESASAEEKITANAEETTDKQEKPPVLDEEEKTEAEEIDKETDNEADAEAEDSESDEDKKTPKGSNATKIGICFALAVLLIIISFGLRYYYTGSFFITGEEQTEPTVIETNEQLFEAMSTLQNGSQPALTENTAYAVNGETISGEKLSSTAANGDYLFICKNNSLYIIGTVGGQMKQVKKIDCAGTLEGVILFNKDFYVVSTETDVATPFTYQKEVAETDADGEDTTKTVEISDTVIRDYLVIERFDGENIGNNSVYRQSGTLTDLFFSDGKICAVTFEATPENAVAEVFDTYMPHCFFEKEQILIDVNNVYLPENAGCKSFLTIAVIDTETESCQLSAVAGGSAPVVFSENNALFVAQNGEKSTLLLRYDLSGTAPVLNGTCTADGLAGAYSGLDISDGNLRFTALETSGENKSLTLSVFDSELNPISKASGLGSGTEPVGSCFDQMNAYVITEQDGQLKLFGVNTSVAEDLTLLTEVTSPITSDKFHKWNDNYGLMLEVEANDDGLRTGLLLSVTDNNGEVISSLRIKAESTVEGDWNKYISSPAEADIDLIRGNSENGFCVLPVSYFDGVSQVEKILMFKIDLSGEITEKGEIVEYDLRSDTLLAEVSDKFCYCIFGGLILSSDADKNSIVAELTLE